MNAKSMIKRALRVQGTRMPKINTDKIDSGATEINLAPVRSLRAMINAGTGPAADFSPENQSLALRGLDFMITRDPERALLNADRGAQGVRDMIDYAQTRR